MEGQKAIGFLKNAYYQGHGRYVNQVARMTLKFCKFGGSSREARKFIETRLVDVARENPGCTLYVKPRMFKSPVLVAEYLCGEHHYKNLYRMSCEQIEAWMSWYMTRSGYELYKLNETLNTATPSIQGHWTPFYFRDPKWNITEFPSEELGTCRTKHPSATDKLIELQKELGTV